MSAGRVAVGVDIKLVDDEGTEVGNGEVGEILVRAPHLMTGYWRNEKATHEAFAPGGWYSPGDLAAMDDDGLVTFHDRKRDMIISGGLNVYPSEVERVIAEHPGVQGVAVVGAPDDEWGEAVVAYVVPTTTPSTEGGDHHLDAGSACDATRSRSASSSSRAPPRLVEQGTASRASRRPLARHGQTRQLSDGR